jgi:hypothetical protein
MLHNAHYGLASSMVGIGNSGEAILSFKCAIVAMPTSLPAIFGLGCALEETDNDAGAVEAYKQVASAEAAETSLDISLSVRCNLGMALFFWRTMLLPSQCWSL